MWEGYGFLTCGHKRGRGPTRRNCNQHIYWECEARLCTLTAITREEYDRLNAGHPTPEEIRAVLGLTD